MDIEWQSSEIAPGGSWRLRALRGDQPLSWYDVLEAWAGYAEAGRAWCRVLADLPPVAFRWEAPAVTTGSLAQPFESVVIEDRALDQRPDPEPFSEHLDRASGEGVIRFANLGGDAMLVVPCPAGPHSAYAHLAAFVRSAPSHQQAMLWQEVAMAMRRRIGQRPVWLNTHGGGVAWLHVRLDDQPKYYTYAPYRTA
jgi:hypothetical protein